MNLVGLLGKTKFLLDANSPTILTGVGAVGTITTAVLTGKGAVKASRILDEEKHMINTAIDLPEDPVELTRSQEFRLVWKCYIPPVVSGIVTITAIIAANRIASKRLAALIVASGISERMLQEYKDKVVEKLGEKQEVKIRDEIAQDRVNKNPPTTSELVLVGEGKVLCMDSLTGRYFESTVEDIKRAENKINSQMIQQMDASLSEFYDEIGLSSTTYSDSVGWNAANLVTVQISTAMSADQRPCLVLNFHPLPFQTYSRYHE